MLVYGLSKSPRILTPKTDSVVAIAATPFFATGVTHMLNIYK